MKPNIKWKLLESKSLLEDQNYFSSTRNMNENCSNDFKKNSQTFQRTLSDKMKSLFQCKKCLNILSNTIINNSFVSGNKKNSRINKICRRRSSLIQLYNLKNIIFILLMFMTLVISECANGFTEEENNFLPKRRTLWQNNDEIPQDINSPTFPTIIPLTVDSDTTKPCGTGPPQKVKINYSSSIVENGLYYFVSFLQ